MGRTGIVALRVLLVLIMLGALAAQLWIFPTLAGELAVSYPELGWLRAPMLAVVVLILIGVQIGLVAIWRLLSMVELDRVFTPRAFWWVDAIIAAAIFDTVLVAGIFAVLSFGAHANPPALAMSLLALVVCGAAFALLMGVMRGLLRKASALTVELSEVV